MQRRNSQLGSKNFQDDNPFKRRGPGAAHAAPLAFSAVQGKHMTPPDDARNVQVKSKSSEQIRPRKQARNADGAGPSTAAQGSAHSMPSEMFPRCRISSMRGKGDVYVRRARESDSDDDMLLDSMDDTGRKRGRHDAWLPLSAPAVCANMSEIQTTNKASGIRNDEAPHVSTHDTLIADELAADGTEHPSGVIHPLGLNHATFLCQLSAS